MTKSWHCREEEVVQGIASVRAELAGVTEGPAPDVWSDIITGLVDARTDPATARFDAEVSAAVADGSLAADLAHRLRFWQRASVRMLADHVTSVLPAAFGALDAARHDAESAAQGSAAALAAAAAAPDHPVDSTAVIGSTGEEEEFATSDDGAEPVRRASGREASGPTTLEADRPRLLVAALVSAHERHDRAT